MRTSNGFKVVLLFSAISALTAYSAWSNDHDGGRNSEISAEMGRGPGGPGPGAGPHFGPGPGGPHFGPGPAPAPHFGPAPGPHFGPGPGPHFGPGPFPGPGRYFDPIRFRRGDRPWAHWDHPYFAPPVYGFYWDRIQYVTCTAANSAGYQYPATLDEGRGFPYRDNMADAENAALDRCYAETGGDASCYLMGCAPTYLP